jgi:schlafen family protein
MPVPNTLNEWTYQVVEGLCTQGQNESDRHDFKFGLPDVHGLTKLCCSFANSDGGFIVVGVREMPGHFVPEGINPDINIANSFGQKIKADPSVPWLPPSALTVPGAGKMLYVFHVPRSPRRPHLPSAVDRRVFWKRTNTGCEPMSLEEIRAQFMNYEERRDKLKLLYLEMLMNRQEIDGISENRVGHNTLPLVDTAVLDRVLVDVYSVIQEDRELVQLLLELRGRINAIRVRTTRFLAEVTPPLADTGRAERMYASWLQSNVPGLEASIDRALHVLQDRFDLQNPLAT